MLVTHIKIRNWRNFKNVDVDLRERQFIVGPNAAGKSNFLDVFRFLRDIARPEGGGLQKALRDRGGLSKVRSLAARQDPEVSFEVHLGEVGAIPTWRYELSIRQETRGRRQAQVAYESASQGSEPLFMRPDPADTKDPERLTQTFLEQISANAPFREVARFFESITYLHLVPQLLQHADKIQGRVIENDPFGQGFLERVARTPEKTRRRRLETIEKALKIAVPQLQQLQYMQDPVTGAPHLQALYSHWRPKAGWQREDQFSDGTLRLIGLLWSLLDGDSLLLLEEPELSLNSGIVAQLAPLIYKMQRSRRRQVFISTHSDALLNERGIDGRETLLLSPAKEGTKVDLATDLQDVRTLLEAGLSVGEAVLPQMKPRAIEQLPLIGLL